MRYISLVLHPYIHQVPITPGKWANQIYSSASRSSQLPSSDGNNVLNLRSLFALSVSCSDADALHIKPISVQEEAALHWLKFPSWTPTNTRSCQIRGIKVQTRPVTFKLWESVFAAAERRVCLQVRKAVNTLKSISSCWNVSFTVLCIHIECLTFIQHKKSPSPLLFLVFIFKRKDVSNCPWGSTLP